MEERESEGQEADKARVPWEERMAVLVGVELPAMAGVAEVGVAMAGVVEAAATEKAVGDLEAAAAEERVG